MSTFGGGAIAELPPGGRGAIFQNGRQLAAQEGVIMGTYGGDIAA